MFSKEDFKDMRHNPFAVPSGRRMSEHYPAIGRLKAFTDVPDLTTKGNTAPRDKVLSATDLNNMVKFVVLMVEPRGNPLAKERNFDVRADEAWGLIGVGRDGGLRKFESQGHWWFHNTLFEYFKLTWDTTYQEWFSQKMAYQEMTRVLAMPMMQTEADKDDVKTRLDISNALGKFRDRIAALESTIFKDQQTTEIVTIQAWSDRIAEKYALEYPSHN
jgi:hypothetical protein